MSEQSNEYPAMGMTAENLAEKYNISREDADLWAFRSQSRWIEAKKSGYFDAEITPGRETSLYNKTRKNFPYFNDSINLF